jgi:hypothetical protein
MTTDPNMPEETAVGDLSQAWNLRDATLLRSDGEPLQTSRFDQNISPDALQAALDRGAKTVRESAPNRDGYAVPLHEKGDPTATNEYVLWRPDSAQVGWYDTSFGIDGTVRFISVETASKTTLSDRLRFWHPELTPVLDDELEEFELPKSEVRPRSNLSVDERRAFFDELKAFVESERETERKANHERYRNSGLETLAAQGIASGPFVSFGANDRPAEPTYTFQISPQDGEGDIDLFRDEEMYPEGVFLIDTMDDSDAFPVAVEIVSVDGPTVTIKPDASCERSGVEEPLTDNGTEFWLTHLLNPVPFERRTEAIRKIESNGEKRELITGNRPVRFEADGLSVPSVEMELNEYQKQALKWADDAEDVLCIHGPPGTGKTRTLTAYVLYAVQHGDSVLVTAHSNQAVDNLLVGDSAVGKPEPGTLHAAVCQSNGNDEDGGDGNEDGLTIARVGRNSKNDMVRRNYTKASVAEADIVAATTSGTAQFDTNQFDVAVVDEATQASRPATAIVLDCARKLVLSGDHKQLPPYCADESMKDEQLHVSLFEHLLDRYGSDISVLLRRQYRMHSAIADFPNAAFYDENLETAARNRDWRIRDLDSLVAIDVVGDERRESGGNSVYNPAEAKAVVAEVTKLIDADVAPKDIGVISMYRGQVGEIRSRLHRTGIEGANRVTVDTVDSFQGGEREAVVVSFVRSNDAGNAGFLELPDEGPRRLNVALTRARKRLVLVGDWQTLASVSPNRRPANSCAHLYDELATNLEREGRFVD